MGQPVDPAEIERLNKEEEEKNKGNKQKSTVQYFTIYSVINELSLICSYL